MADTRRLPVNGIPDPLYEAIITIAAREGKTLSRVGLDALELLARERGEWPPGHGGRRVTPSRFDIAWATEQVMAVLERREEPVPSVEAIARDGVVKVLRVCFARGACPGCGKSPNGDWRGWHADDCVIVAFCESNGIDLSEVEDG